MTELESGPEIYVEIGTGGLITVEVIGEGPAGPEGPPGEIGPQGDAFTYDDFTPEQLAALTGPQGADGSDGQDGAPGQDGADGVSPEVTITEITGGHTVTITDADHPAGQTFNVMDGTDGQDGAPGAGVASGGSAGQLLKKKSGTDYDTEWASVTVPAASDDTPQAAGTAAAGSSAKYSRADHVHAKPSYTKSDVGLGNVDNVKQYSASNPPPYPVTSVNGSTGAVSLSIPATAGDVGAIPAPSSPTTGQFLKWSGSAWVASDLPVYNGGVS